MFLKYIRFFFYEIHLKRKTHDCSKQSKFMKPTYYFSNKTTL